MTVTKGKATALILSVFLGAGTCWAGNLIAWGENAYRQTNVPPDLGRVTGVAAGDHHSVALLEDGTISAWGRSEQGQLAAPASLTNAVVVAAGGYHSLALTAQGGVVAWGSDNGGQCQVPESLGPAVALDAGAWHSLALLADGAVASWGYDNNGQWRMPEGMADKVAIAAGSTHNLALGADGTVVAWGDNTDGKAQVPEGLTNVVAISAGMHHSLALRADGTAVAWGSNIAGQGLVPSWVTQAVAVSAGQYHNLALFTDGTVRVWGGQAYPPAVTGMVAIAAADHNLALQGTGAPVIPPRVRRIRTVLGVPLFIRVQPVGAPPMTGRWFKDEVPLEGAGGFLLEMPDSTDNAGVYRCVVSNALGVAEGPAVTVETAAVIIDRHPQGMAAVIGQSRELSASVRAARPVSFQWFRNGAPLAGATSTVCRLAPVGLGDDGIYQLVISNRFGIATSEAARLAVNNVAAWGGNPEGQCTVPGTLTQAVAVAAGFQHSLALRADGTVIAWGYSGDWQTAVPKKMGRAMAIAAGNFHSMALLTNGTVRAWGAGLATRVPAGLDRVVAIAAGGVRNLALRSDGTVAAWSAASVEKLFVPTDLANVVAVAANGHRFLALRADGTVAAWGDRGYEEEGMPAEWTQVVALASGGDESVALRADGSVAAWNDPEDVPAPLAHGYVAAGGVYHRLVLNDRHTVEGWGNNYHGQTDAPGDLSNVVAIAAGGFHSLGVVGVGKPALAPMVSGIQVPLGKPAYLLARASGELPIRYRWEKNGLPIEGAERPLLTITETNGAARVRYRCIAVNRWGETTGTTVRVTAVPFLFNRRPAGGQVPAGQAWSLDAGVSGAEPASYQWIKDGVPVSGATSRVLPLEAMWAADEGSYCLVASNGFGCATSTAVRLSVSHVIAFGNNAKRQAKVPAGLGPVKGVAAGGWHSLALLADGTVRAWGDNGEGQRTVPAGMKPAVAVAAGLEHSLALLANGSVRAWGANDTGQATVPAGLGGVVAIAAGGGHSLALRADGTVAAWGDNGFGQRTVPPGLDQVVAIAAGLFHSLALRADGSIAGWGLSGQGQLDLPPDLGRAVGIAAGDYFSAALLEDGTVVAWGNNDYGQQYEPAGPMAGLAAGDKHLLAIRDDGGVAAWGYDWYGQSTAPAGLGRIGEVSGGYGHSLALVAPRKPFLKPMVRRLASPSSTAMLRAVAVGARPMQVRWMKDGLPLEGDEPGLLRVAWTNGGSGSYVCVASNAEGVVTGEPVRVVFPGRVCLGAAAVTVREGTVGAIAVHRSDGDEGPISVDYVLKPKSAKAGQDYVAASGTLAWADGDAAVKTIRLRALADGLREGDEVFQLVLGKPKGTVLGWPSKAKVMIRANSKSCAPVPLPLR